MSVPITALYAGVCAFVLLALAARVIRLRWALKVGIGDGGERTLNRAIRVHGNAAEYVPIALVLMLVAELGQPDLLEEHANPVVDVTLALVLQLHDQFHVLPGGEHRNQVERLKDKTDVAKPEVDQLVRREACNIDAVNADRS